MWCGDGVGWGGMGLGLGSEWLQERCDWLIVETPDDTVSCYCFPLVSYFFLRDLRRMGTLSGKRLSYSLQTIL